MHMKRSFHGEAIAIHPTSSTLVASHFLVSIGAFELDFLPFDIPGATKRTEGPIEKQIALKFNRRESAVGAGIFRGGFAEEFTVRDPDLWIGKFLTFGGFLRGK